MVYYVLYYYNSSLLQSTLLLTRYTCTNVFPTAENFSGNLFSADVVQDLQRFLFHFADISKTVPFHLAFHTMEQEKVAWHKVG